jgi:hypothetical protein
MCESTLSNPLPARRPNPNHRAWPDIQIEVALFDRGTAEAVVTWSVGMRADMKRRCDRRQVEVITLCKAPRDRSAKGLVAGENGQLRSQLRRNIVIANRTPRGIAQLLGPPWISSRSTDQAPSLRTNQHALVGKSMRMSTWLRFMLIMCARLSVMLRT